MNKLWLCGQVREGSEGAEDSWEFQGVFSSRELAIAACRSDSYFIYPVTLD